MKSFFVFYTSFGSYNQMTKEVTPEPFSRAPDLYFIVVPLGTNSRLGTDDLLPQKYNT